MFLTDLLEEKLVGMTVVYGAAASGKTTIALSALSGKCAYIASGHNFSPERLHAMRSDATLLLAQTSVFTPKDLVELERAVEQAVRLSGVLSLIIIDSLGAMTRLGDRTAANLSLSRIMERLATAHCPVLIMTDVLDRPVGGSSERGFVGGDLLRFSARTIVELRDDAATVKKHPALVGRTWRYQIVASGLEKL